MALILFIFVVLGGSQTRVLHMLCILSLSYTYKPWFTLSLVRQLVCSLNKDDIIEELLVFYNEALTNKAGSLFLRDP